MYVAYYGRPADPAGLEFWCDKFDETDDLDQALEAFGESDEYEDGFGGLTDEALIDNLYQQMFNHDADEYGLAFYLERLESGEATLASIAKQIADGAVDSDRDALDNKVEVSNTFTDEVDSTGADYDDTHIDGAKALIANVDETDESVEEGNQNAVDAVGLLGGVVVLTEDGPEADFSSSANGLTIILRGDDNDTQFDVTGTAFGDIFLVEEYLRADLSGGAGDDTVDFTDAEGDYTISLGTQNFTSDLDGDGLPDISGTLLSIQAVIGSDQDDVINGGDGDDTLSGGDGADVLRGGAGDDTFLYENEDDLGTETVEGQTGTDVLDLSGAEIDLSATESDNLSVETLILSNGDGENSVSLTLTTTADGGETGPESFDLIKGSSAQDRLVLADGTNADLSATALEDIETVTTLEVDTDSLDDVVTLVAEATTGTIELAGGRGTYDFSGTSFSGWTLVAGDGAIAETLVLNQTQIDALLDEGGSNTAFGGGLVNTQVVDTTTYYDTLQASGSLDLTRVSSLAILEVEFGTATIIEIDEAQLDDGVTRFIGASGTLLLNEDNGDLDLVGYHHIGSCHL